MPMCRDVRGSGVERVGGKGSFMTIETAEGISLPNFFVSQ